MIVTYKNDTNKIIKFKTEEEAEDYAKKIYDERIEYFTIE